MDTYLTVHGNLVADPTHRTTANGASVVHLRVASSGRKFDKASGQFRDGDPMFISASCWRGLAVNVMTSLRKGDSVIVHGRLQSRTYDDKEGVRRNVHEIDAIALGPDLARCPVEVRRPTRQGDQETAPAAPAPPQAGDSAAVEQRSPAAA
jgi:single-strand DNA-binding protein